MMTPRDIAIPLDRVTWRDGQTLTSADLRDDQRYVDRLRHLHVRYQHKTWGVVEGLNAIAAGTGAVRVGRGYALDIEGRELLLPATQEIATPAGAMVGITMYLVISRDAVSGACSQTPDLALLCPGVKNPVPVGKGVISWKTVDQVRIGYDILLARVLISNGQLASKVDTSVRRHATSMRQPYTWSDVTLAGQTGWADVTSGVLPEITATVDTSDAGFTSAPAYFAWLTGSSQIAQSFISSADAASFTFVARPAAAAQGFNADKRLTALQAEDAGLTVAWFAVELLQKGL